MSDHQPKDKPHMPRRWKENVLGYVNAAQYALYSAVRRSDPETAEKIGKIAKQITTLQEELENE